MAGVSSEEENYLRLFMLILEPGTTAIRVVFDRYFPPLQLESQFRGSLNISLKKLKKSKIINSAQWDILFPSSGHVSSQEFDITLMICLLRNLSNLPRPINGFDALPPRNCYNTEDDVARIKYCRNFQAHSHPGRLDNNTFAALWSDARSAIERLDQSIAAECEKIEAMTFTSIHRTLLSQLLASNDELRKNVEVIEEQGKRIGELETKCLQICRNMEDSDKLPKLLQGIQRREISKWKIDDEAFIDTTLSKEFLRQVQNVSIITVTGHSGVGKTSLLRHTALKLQEKGYSVIPLTAIKDLKLNYCRNVKQVFVIDDPLGTIELSKERLQSWHDNEIHIVRVLNDTKSKLLISVGISIACTNEFKIFNSLNNHVFQMTLSIEDRKQILNGSFKNSIKLSDRILQIHECFPLLCSAFQSSGQQHVVAEEFFTHPFEVFNHQLRSLRISSPETYITFILLVFDNCSTD